MLGVHLESSGLRLAHATRHRTAARFAAARTHLRHSAARLGHRIVARGFQDSPSASFTSTTRLIPRLASRRARPQTIRLGSARHTARFTADAAPSSAPRPRLQATRARLDAASLEARQMLHKWQQQHRMTFMITGGVLGALLTGLAVTYLLGKPKVLDFIWCYGLEQRFNSVTEFDKRVELYFQVPQFQLPPLMPSEGSFDVKENPLQIWLDAVISADKQLSASRLMKIKTKMRDELIKQAGQLGDTKSRVDALQQLLAASTERNMAIEQQLADDIARGCWIPGPLLEANQPQDPCESCDLATKLLSSAISFFPGPSNYLILALEGLMSPAEAAERVASTVSATRKKAVAEGLEIYGKEVNARALTEAFHTVKRQYDRLHDMVKGEVLHSSLTTTIKALPDLPEMAGTRPYDLYVSALDKHLIAPLASDARISKDLLGEVKAVFLALPSDIQARVLLTAIVHPATQPVQTEESLPDRATLVRDLLSSGGIVAVKMAQSLCEHPQMPDDYRKLLGSLRDDNEPMSLATFWHSIPPSVRANILELGPCLGVGSVKQVHVCRYIDNSAYAVAVLRRRVEDEALSSVNALESSPQLGPVAARLGHLIFGEFDLFSEGEALEVFSKTSIGLHPLFRVVGVRHHSPKCLLEEVAKGDSVGKVLSSPNISKDKVEETKKVLVEYHRAVFDAFVADGLIHSDIHLGNACVSTTPDNKLGFVLFDVGQYERIGVADTKALLWMLAAISNADRMRTLRAVALAHMENVCSSEGPPQRFKEELGTAFDNACAPLQNGSMPDQRTAYMSFLREAESRKIKIPKGAFAVAKMLDAMVSQQINYNLTEVANESIEKFLKKNITWGESASIAYQQSLQRLGFGGSAPAAVTSSPQSQPLSLIHI